MTEARVTQVGSYVETSAEQVQVTQAGVYVETSAPGARVTQAGAYVESEPESTSAALLSDDIMANFVSMWEMDETSGLRSDELKNHPLTPYNNPSYTTGIIGNAVQFIAANNSYLISEEHADFAAGDQDWTFWLWFKPDFDGEQTLATGSPNLTWTLTTDDDPSDQLIARLYDDVGAVAAECAVAVSDSNWHMSTMMYDSDKGILYLALDDGDWTADFVTGTLLSPAVNAIKFGMNPASNAAADNGAWSNAKATDKDKDKTNNGGKGNKWKDLSGIVDTISSGMHIGISIGLS